MLGWLERRWLGVFIVPAGEEILRPGGGVHPP
jgi:hypothetical protein